MEATVRELDAIVIGAGPGGYETAERLAAEGRRTAIIERDSLGGTCLNRGCIPTKCLCASANAMLMAKRAAEYGVEITGDIRLNYGVAYNRMQKVIAGLQDGVRAALKDVEVINGTARLAADRKVIVGDQVLTAKQIIIATGSQPARLRIEGAELAQTSDDFLKSDKLPASVAVIGGGVIGIEFASILAAFGVEVTVIEFCKEILPPFDAEIAKRLRTYLTRRGIKIITGAAVKAIKPGFEVIYEGKKGDVSVTAEQVIMAVGRRPVLPEGLAEAGVELTERGYIKVNPLMETTAPGIYAIGDVNGKCMLAHAASAQGRVAMGVDVALELVPSVVFSVPEAAMVGMTEAQCEAENVEYAVAKTMYGVNGKAHAMGETDGIVKIIYSTKTRCILGVHVVGEHAADLAAEAYQVIHNLNTVEEVRDEMIHAHPTLSELIVMALANAK
jgi:dihydrolipoamide dehydrogenase